LVIWSWTAWGYNKNSITLHTIGPGNVHAEDIGLGAHNTCIIKNIYTVQRWGWNRNGKVGDGTGGEWYHNRNTPTAIDLG